MFIVYTILMSMRSITFKEIFLPCLIWTQGNLQRWKDSLLWTPTSQMVSHPISQSMGLLGPEILLIILLPEVW